jgi:MoaA/NifB/PqqE/SkfB family radical SAM enzyme
MHLATLGQLAFKHTRNALAESLYFRTGMGAIRPVAIYGLVNQRCNARCSSCEFWRMKQYLPEMTIAQWQEALLSLKAFVGKYSINLTGGEPFLKRGFVELLEFCRQHGILAGTTTNGSCFSVGLVRRVVAARPFNINISVDAPHADLHDHLRGMPGLFARLSEGIRRLIQARSAQKASFPIIIKPTINAKNLHCLPEIVEWAQRIGATSVNFQPLERWTPETYHDLWIEEDQLGELQQVVDRLTAMKRRGAPILNTELSLRLLPNHFREEKAPQDMLPCRVGLRNYFIAPNGDVTVCGLFAPLGNVCRQSARDIWYGETAQRVRRQTTQCRRLCLSSCTSQKMLKDKFKMAWQLLKVGKHPEGS